MTGSLARGVLVLGLLPLFFLSQMVEHSLCQGCQYEYTYQPPHDLSCNPYSNNAMYVECAIKGPNLLTIQWYFSPSNGNSSDTIELQNISKYTINNVTSDVADFISQLTVRGFMDDSDAGIYWCTGVLVDGSMLQTLSSELVVEEAEFYVNHPFACIEGQFLKNSEAKCVSVVVNKTTTPHTELVKPTTTTASATESSTALVSSLESGTTLVSSAESSTASETAAGGKISPTLFIIVLVVTLSVVVILLVMCTILTTIVGLQCRRRIKLRNEHRGFHGSSGQFLNPITQSTESHFNRKEGSGEYAEIGPAIIATVAQHMTDNPHYSSIDNSMLKPPEVHLQRREHPDGSHIIENPYDALTSPKETHNTPNGIDKPYSRLDRMIPTSGGPGKEKQAAASTAEISLTSEQTLSKISPSVGEVVANTEHPYYILEGPKDATETSSDTDSWSTSSSQSIHLPKDSENKLDNPDRRDSPEEERYQTSDNFSFHDTPKNAYDHLEARNVMDSEESKYRNLEYLEPVNTVKPKEIREDDSNSSEENGTTLKYSGDYERDPIYMERIHNSVTPTSHYQTLVESTMDPSDNYTKVQPQSK